jgi:hypothetical protein
VVSGIQALYACLGGLGLASFAAGVWSLARSDRRNGDSGSVPGRVAVPPGAPTAQSAPAEGPRTVVPERVRPDPPRARSAGSTDA